MSVEQVEKAIMDAEKKTLDLDALEALEEMSFRAAPVGWRLFAKGGVIEISLPSGKLGEHPCVVSWPGFDGCGLPFRLTEQNAKLIVAARNALPELIRLARIGQRVERDATEGTSAQQPASPEPSQECVMVPMEMLEEWLRWTSVRQFIAGNSHHHDAMQDQMLAMLAAAKEEHDAQG